MKPDGTIESYKAFILSCDYRVSPNTYCSHSSPAAGSSIFSLASNA